jgi:phosphoesterase RecJ-like protein
MSAANASFAEIASVLRAARRIGCSAHVRPDGDALGSVLAFAQSMKLAGKEIIPLSQDGVPWHLDFLPGSDGIRQPDGNALDIDVAVALDTATKDRLGEGVVTAFQNATTVINIDHHGSNPRYGTLNLIDTAAPATGEIVHDLLVAEGFPFDNAVRENLFAAISTDTGSFQYSSTTAHTHEVIAAMMREGLNTARMSRLLYDQNPIRRVELLRTLLNEMQFRADGQIATWLYPQATKQRIGVLPGDTEGLIDHLRSIDTVRCAVIFEEQRDGRIRVSARSKDDRIDVSKICALFGGGGHRLAAGATMPGPIEAAAEQYLKALEHEV